MQSTGEAWGPFQIDQAVGAGGWAVVYKANHPDFGEPIALKVLLPHRLLNAEHSSRFQQEAKAVSNLHHPHIVRMLTTGQIEQVPYVAYEFCSGPSLSQWLEEHGELEPQAAVMVLIQLADAIETAHNQGIVHRDLKPANVLLFPDPQSSIANFPYRAALTDFGLAKILESTLVSTRTSQVLGTPLYLAPEQLDAIDPLHSNSFDLYALGVLLYECLTGQNPFETGSLVRTLELIRSGSYRRLRKTNPKLPRSLERIVDKALSQEPSDRYASAADFRADLERYLKQQPIAARPPSALKRFKRFASKMARVGQAAGYVLLSHCVLLTWVLLWPGAVFLHLPIAQNIMLRDVLPYSVPQAIVHVISIVLAWFLFKNSRLAAALLTLSGLGLAAYQGGVLVRLLDPPYPVAYGNDRTRDIVFSLLVWFFVVQFILCSIAGYALQRQAVRNRKHRT